MMRNERNKKIEEEIVFHFFARNRIDRALFLINKNNRTNDLFDYLQDKYLDQKKMHMIPYNYLREQDIFKEISKKSHCVRPYFFSYGLKGYISMEELNLLDMMEFQETIIYFGNGIGYFQAHEKGGSRERFILKNNIV